MSVTRLVRIIFKCRYYVEKINKGYQTYVSFTFFELKSCLIFTKNVFYQKKNNQKIQNPENGIPTVIYKCAADVVILEELTTLSSDNSVTMVLKYKYNYLTVTETYFLCRTSQK